MVRLDPAVVERIREDLSAGALAALDRVAAADYIGAVVDVDEEAGRSLVRLMGEHPHREVASRLTVSTDRLGTAPEPPAFVWLELSAAVEPEVYRVVVDDALTEAMVRYHRERRRLLDGRRGSASASSPGASASTASSSSGSGSILAGTGFESAG